MAEVPPFTMPYPDWLSTVMVTTGLLERARREDTKRHWSLEGLLQRLTQGSYVAVVPDDIRRLVQTYARNVGEGAPTLDDIGTLHGGLRRACLEWLTEHPEKQA
jgi:hypothetical protein